MLYKITSSTGYASSLEWQSRAQGGHVFVTVSRGCIPVKCGERNVCQAMILYESMKDLYFVTASAHFVHLSCQLI